MENGTKLKEDNTFFFQKKKVLGKKRYPGTGTALFVLMMRQ